MTKRHGKVLDCPACAGFGAHDAGNGFGGTCRHCDGHGDASAGDVAAYRATRTIGGLERAAGISDRAAFWLQFAHIKGTIERHGRALDRGFEAGLAQLRWMAEQRDAREASSFRGATDDHAPRTQ